MIDVLLQYTNMYLQRNRTVDDHQKISKRSITTPTEKKWCLFGTLCLTRAEDASGIEILLRAMGLKRFRTFALPSDSTTKARRIHAKEQLISYLKL
ncbi:hypothetical protein AVEN_75266-1 [Araneus ventricosus]|uniref:Uncharacterized protein n=1 Tax=Araneus ventricosus TaxID=182803 RepID=A0A4Y2ILG6_ARAVE|nr:hypothetical protein AVEN_75266-1 [Araneus ventricosus]